MTTTRSHARRNTSRPWWHWLTGCCAGLFLLAILAAIIIAFVLWNPFHWFTAPTQVYVTPAATQIPFAQAETCPSIVGPTDTTQYVEFDLTPNTTVAGDFEALISGKWVILHDNGVGQYEIYRNVGTEVVKMRGHWGGGCLMTTDVKTLVNGEYQNPNHGDFVRAHLVTFSTANDYVEKMYQKSELPLK